MPTDMGRYEIRVAGGGGEVVGVACGDGQTVVLRTWVALPENSSLTMRTVGDARWRELQDLHPVTYGPKRAA